MNVEELKQRITRLEEVIEIYNEFGFKVSQEIKDRVRDNKRRLRPYARTVDSCPVMLKTKEE